jgi:hypothetical protein
MIAKTVLLMDLKYMKNRQTETLASYLQYQL